MSAKGSLKFEWKEKLGADAYVISRFQDNEWHFLVRIENINILSIDIPNIEYSSETPIKVSYLQKGSVDPIAEEIFYCFLTRDNKVFSYRCRTPDAIEVIKISNGNLIRWNAVEGACKYRVHRRVAKGKWERVGVTVNTQYIDTDVCADYYYTIRCISDDEKRCMSSFNRKGVCASPNQACV